MRRNGPPKGLDVSVNVLVGVEYYYGNVSSVRKYACPLESQKVIRLFLFPITASTTNIAYLESRFSNASLELGHHYLIWQCSGLGCVDLLLHGQK
jgi:hypothetical protein